ncbi:MAG: NADH-quinone oxidoreductase subunit NuoN [Bdellovibrionales bacterium]
MDISQSITVAMPELTLAVLGLGVLLGGLSKRAETPIAINMLAIIAIGLTLITVFLPARLAIVASESQTGAMLAFNGMFRDDAFARFAKTIILIASAFALMMSQSYLRKEKIAHAEYPALILFATLGMMLMVSANHALALYVGLELQSLSLYVLAAFNRDNARSSEAGLKYFVLGALSSGLLLYGLSLIYGFTGTLDFARLATVAGTLPTDQTQGLVVGLVFVCAALAFKISAVPFHMWTPDVYEGAPTSVTTFFAAAPKVAAMALLARFLYGPLGAISEQWQQIMVLAAVASMLVGACAGVMQTNLKRLMAYSTIANIGFALVGLATAGREGAEATFVYLAIYTINVIGAFGVLLALRGKGRELENIKDIAGLSKTNPALAFAMAVFMFSLAGVPPLAGFFGKYIVFVAAVKANMVPLAVLGVAASAIAAFYYLRVVKLMYFDDATKAGAELEPTKNLGIRFVVSATALLAVIFAIWPSPLIDGARLAINSLLLG